AAASAHAIGDHGQHATRHARMADQHDLVLLVGPVPLVEAGGGGESETSWHGWKVGPRGRRQASLQGWRGGRSAYYQMNLTGSLRAADRLGFQPSFPLAPAHRTAHRARRPRRHDRPARRGALAGRTAAAPIEEAAARAARRDPEGRIAARSP